MTETTLERMARAAYEKRPYYAYIKGEERTIRWGAITDAARQSEIEGMRAALQVARTPDHEITAAVVKPGADRTQAVLDFRAMIDAILREKP